MRQIVLPALLALSACMPAAGTAPASGGAIDGSYGIGGARWESGTTVYAFAGARQEGGQVTLCAAWTVEADSALAAPANEKVIGAAVVTLAGDRIAQGLGFARRMTFAGTDFAAYQGAPADCVRTGVPWRAEYGTARPEISFPRMRISS